MRLAIYLASSLIFSLPYSLSAQITLTADDVPNVGDVLEYVSDTMPMGLTPGPAGENQTWDFAQVSGADTFSTTFVNPAEAPNFDLFPNANLALRSDTIYSYALLTQDGLFNLGTAIETPITDDPVVVRFEPPQTTFRFPLSFGSSYEDTYTFTIALPADSVDLGVPLEFDSVRISHTEDVTITADAYGQITTDFSTFDVLRLYSVSDISDRIEIQVSGAWTPLFNEQSMNETYQWVAKDGFGPVFSLFLDETGVVTEAQWLSDRQTGAGVVAPVAQFSFAAQGGGTVAFTDQSTNMPASWSWDFDDGSSSNQQSPTHTFAASGTYNVCLTVENSAGQNTSCQTVEIMLTSTERLRAEYGFQLYPNPAAEQVRIELKHAIKDNLFISIRNSLGQELFKSPLREPLNLNIQTWPAGSYPFFVQSQTGETLGSGWLQVSR